MIGRGLDRGNGSRAGLACLVALACACASDDVGPPSPEVFSHEEPGADFGGYRTYGYADPLGTDGPGGRSQLSGFLVEAMDAEMQRRGYRRSDSPDLLVDFSLLTVEQQAPGPTSSEPIRYRRGRYGQWRGQETTTIEYIEGSLVIDLVEVRTNALVWEGMAQGPMQSAPEQVTQERASHVVRLILERFGHEVN
jgi:hypothetical protein